MAVKLLPVITNINSYVVNQLMGGYNVFGAPTNNLLETLEQLNQDYAEISAFGKKLNDIYNFLTQNGASESALNGARSVFLSIVKSPNGLSGIDTINNLYNLNSNPEVLEKFFSLSNEITNNSLNLSGWLEAYKNASTYGYGEQFLNETESIINNSNSDELSNIFNKFLEGVVYATTNIPSPILIQQYLNTLFTGLAASQTPESKLEFLEGFMGVG